MKKMKLTLEQKAFYEYGKAREALRLFKTDFAYREETLREFYENYVRNAWQKRAACRAWMIPSHERICENCAHEGTHPYATPCSECFRCPFAQVYEGFSDNWEPRKEGE